MSASAVAPIAEQPLRSMRAEPAVIGPAPRPTFREIYDSWVGWLVADDNNNLLLHPDLALSPVQARGARPIIYARTGDEGAVTSIGVMVDRPYHVRPVAGLPLRVSLRGYKLLGSRLLGDCGPRAAGGFCSEIGATLRAADKECLYVEDLEVDSNLWAALLSRERRETVAIQARPAQAHWWIRFPEQVEGYWDHFSSRTRSKFRQKAKKLGRLHCFQAEHEVPAFLEQARAISELSWQTKRLGLRVTGATDETAYWNAVARLGAMRSYGLEHNGKLIAFALATQWNSIFSYEEIAYDSRYADLSPGTVLLFRILQDVVERDPARKFDFGIGDAEYKRLFANHQTRSGAVLLIRRHIRPMIAAGMAAVRQRASRLARAGLQDSWLLRAARRIRRTA